MTWGLTWKMVELRRNNKRHSMVRALNIRDGEHEDLCRTEVEILEKHTKIIFELWIIHG